MKAFFSLVWLAFFSLLLIFTIGCFYGYFYPTKYKAEITQYASDFNVKPELVASIINVESSFKEKRISSKGAVGLMQIMPSTAEWISLQLDENFEEIDLYAPKTNIKYGAYYISYLLDYFKNLELTICAYNAGMGNVKKWMEDEKFFKDNKLVKIPFNETKSYLQKVLKNLRYYENKY